MRFIGIVSLILGILGFVGITLFPEWSCFNDPPSFLREQPSGQPTPHKPPPIRTTKPQQPTRTQHTTVSQPWEQLISILKSHDSDIDRSQELSDLESRLPSRLSPGELISIIELFNSNIYRSSALSDLESRLPSRLSPGELISIIELFDSDIYRSSVLSDLESRLPSRLSWKQLSLIVELFDSDIYQSSARSDLESRLTFH